MRVTWLVRWGGTRVGVLTAFVDTTLLAHVKRFVYPPFDILRHESLLYFPDDRRREECQTLIKNLISLGMVQLFVENCALQHIIQNNMMFDSLQNVHIYKYNVEIHMSFNANHLYLSVLIKSCWLLRS
jgi:hypothetical protein